eukprot:PhF_6_TR38121/c0_g1_i5/m.56905
MPQVFVSAVIPSPIEKVWATVRPFDTLKWGEPSIEITITNSKANDQVGAVRAIAQAPPAVPVVETLLLLDDRTHTFEYRIDSAPFPTKGYVGRLQVIPITDTNESFVQWEAQWESDTVESGAAVRENIVKLFTGCLANLKKNPPK